MPRIRRSKLARKLATVALGGATLAVVTGQLPAVAYGPCGCGPDRGGAPPPPGGYHNVVTSQTCGPAGCVIRARIEGLLASVTVPPRDLPRDAQVTLLAPNVRGIGDAGHSRYRIVAGVGVPIQVNGRALTGTVTRPITVRLSGRQIRPADRMAVWNGANFALIAGRATASTEAFGYHSAAEQDFAVLAPRPGGRGHRPGQRPGQRGEPALAGFSRAGQLSQVMLQRMFFAPLSAVPAGAGVLSVAWPAVRSH